MLVRGRQCSPFDQAGDQVFTTAGSREYARRREGSPEQEPCRIRESPPGLQRWYVDDDLQAPFAHKFTSRRQSSHRTQRFDPTSRRYMTHS